MEKRGVIGRNMEKGGENGKGYRWDNGEEWAKRGKG